MDDVQRAIEEAKAELANDPRPYASVRPDVLRTLISAIPGEDDVERMAAAIDAERSGIRFVSSEQLARSAIATLSGKRG